MVGNIGITRMRMEIFFPSTYYERLPGRFYLIKPVKISVGTIFFNLSSLV
jgi:hypothetical protein